MGTKELYGLLKEAGAPDSPNVAWKCALAACCDPICVRLAANSKHMRGLVQSLLKILRGEGWTRMRRIALNAASVMLNDQVAQVAALDGGLWSFFVSAIERDLSEGLFLGVALFFASLSLSLS